MRLPLEVPRTLEKHMSGIFILELSHADRVTTALHELARCLFKAFIGHLGVQAIIFQGNKSDSSPYVGHALLTVKYCSQEFICARDSPRVLARHGMEVLGFKDVLQT